MNPERSDLRSGVIYLCFFGGVLGVVVAWGTVEVETVMIGGVVVAGVVVATVVVAFFEEELGAINCHTVRVVGCGLVAVTCGAFNS